MSSVLVLEIDDFVKYPTEQSRTSWNAIKLVYFNKLSVNYNLSTKARNDVWCSDICGTVRYVKYRMCAKPTIHKRFNFLTGPNDVGRYDVMMLRTINAFVVPNVILNGPTSG